MMSVALLVGIAVAAAVGLFIFGLGRVLEPVGDLQRRIEEWVGGERWDDGDLVQEEADSFLGRMDKEVGRRDFAASIKEDLAQADLSLTVTEYLLIRGMLVVLFALVGYLIQHNLLVALVMAAVGLFLPTIYVRSRQTRRLRKFDSQLPDVLDHLQGSLRAGYGLLQAVEWIARQLPNPAGLEFDRVVREVQLGRGLMEALESMVRRIPSDDLSLIVTAIKIQYEVGGSLAEILEIVAHTIRERVRIMREINVLTSQQRYSGYVLIIMPIALALFLILINPEYEMRLFEPGPTLCIPIGAAVLMFLGYIIMRRIVDIEV
ncbi:MAG: type II secretion system F family protein [Anaerolineae bacterium]